MNIDEYTNIIEPVVNRNNCLLWGIEILRGKKRVTLRVYIDSEKNIDISDCENVSKDLSYEPMIDLNLGDDYILEVSTPGIDRKFFDLNQLKAYVGKELELKTRESFEGKRKFSGKLLSCDELYFFINSTKDSNQLKFKFSDIDLCRLKPNYNEFMKEHSYGK